MKTLYLIPLLFLTACSTTPKLALQPRTPASLAADTVRYPEIVRAYHFGRYIDPTDDLVMHEQHVAYRVEENARWDFHPGTIGEAGFLPTSAARNAAFSPLPVNDAVLAEVNAQKLATVQIMQEAQTLTSALAQFQTALQQTQTNWAETAGLRESVIEMKKRLDALEAAPAASSSQSNVLTNESSDSLTP
jgi:hypothetical protein